MLADEHCRVIVALVAHRVATRAKEWRTGVGERRIGTYWKDVPVIVEWQKDAVIGDQDVVNHHLCRAWAVADATLVFYANAGVDVVTDAVTVSIALAASAADA